MGFPCLIKLPEHILLTRSPYNPIANHLAGLKFGQPLQGFHFWVDEDVERNVFRTYLSHPSIKQPDDNKIRVS